MLADSRQRQHNKQEATLFTTTATMPTTTKMRRRLVPIVTAAVLAVSASWSVQLLATTVSTVAAFVVPQYHSFHVHNQQRHVQSSSQSSTALQAKKVKRGGLADVAEAGAVVNKGSSSRRRRQQKQQQRQSSKSSPSPSSTSTEGIAPGLADWVASKRSSSSSDDSIAILDSESDVDDDIDIDSQTTTKSKKKMTKDKKMNQKTNNADIAIVRNEQIDSLLGQLDDALEEKGNLAGILSVVRQLFDVASTTTGNPTAASLKQLLASKPGRSGGQGSKPQYNFRLAWVGSDDALCHIGTGLHKVPLARMQEVFMSMLGRNRIEILEVISITGPFPNVRNTLQGSTKIMKSDGGIGGGSRSSGTNLRINVDSMTDGTGKELLAPGEKARIVDLDVYFSDERVIVAVVPPSAVTNGKDDDNNTNSPDGPMQKDGQNVLIFVREDDLDGRLDALRVS